MAKEKKQTIGKTEKEKSSFGVITLRLSKKDIDSLADYLESEEFRNYGYGHINLEEGGILIIECNDLIKNREGYEKHLEKFGLKAEITQFSGKANGEKSEESNINETSNLRKQLEEVKKLAEERLNQLKYLQADFDNYRKQFEKEKEQIIKLSNENLIRELIIILDDFENSIKSIKNEENKKGIELLHKKFYNLLEKHGLKSIDALGKKFDPNFHEVLCNELSEKEEGHILEEIQKGYCLCSKVIRPSKVKVSKKLERNQKVEEVKN